MFPRQLPLLLTTLFFYSTQYASCQKLFNVINEVCCDGTIQAQPADVNVHYRCCGSQLLHYGDGVCCDGTIVPNKHNVTGEHIDWGCCSSGDQVNLYNTITQRCCQGNVIDVGNNFSIACCGNTTYNTLQGCCDIFPSMDMLNRPNIYCCGDQLFNFTTHLCCSQWPKAPLDTEDLTKRKPQFKLQPLPDELKLRPQQRCCGLELFDFTSKVCCDGVLHRRHVNSSMFGTDCCGSKMMTNRDKEICCPGGQVRARDSRDQLCCGDRLFNHEHELCCRGQVITKADNVSCCWEAGKVYDPMTHRCCGDQIMPISANHSEPFGKIQCCSKRPKHTILANVPVG